MKCASSGKDHSELSTSASIDLVSIVSWRTMVTFESSICTCVSPCVCVCVCCVCCVSLCACECGFQFANLHLYNTLGTVSTCTSCIYLPSTPSFTDGCYYALKRSHHPVAGSADE